MEAFRDLAIEAIQGGSVFGLAFAFVFGLISFLSPCVLPMAPPYLAYIGGTTLDQGWGGGARVDGRAARRVFFSAVFVVLGLAVVFVGLGIGMASAGNFMLDQKHNFALVSGVVICAFGMHFWGLRGAMMVTAVSVGLLALWWLLLGQDLPERFGEAWLGLVLVALAAVALNLSGWEKIPILNREARFEGPVETGSAGSSFLIGMAFAFGWTPCLGPILATILSFAGQTGDMVVGGVLLAFYALGLGVPFLVAALFIGPFLRWAHGFRRHLGLVERIMGAMLLAVGIMMITGDFERLAYFLLETFPSLATIG